MALWSLSLLAAFTVSLGYGVRQKAALFDRLDTMSFLYPEARSGIEAARGLMKAQDTTPLTDGLMDDWAQNKALFREVTLGERGYFSVSYPVLKSGESAPVVYYGLVDEQSKININTSDAATLTRVLQTAGGLDKDTAEEIAYCIIDWRDTDSTLEHPNYGAEEDYYTHLETPYESKNAPFETIDELLLVKGINRALFDKIKGFLTPFGPGAVNINTAPKEILLALGIQEQLVDRIINYRRGEDREERTADDHYFAQATTIGTELNNVDKLTDADMAALNNLISSSQLGTSSTHFMVKSRGVLSKNGAYVEMESVIDRKGKVFYLRTSNIQWPSKA